MLKKLMAFCLLPLLVALPTSAIVGAVEKLDGDSFRAACKAHRSGPQGTGENALCAAFVLGYLSAAEGFYVQMEGDRSYHRRAVETRAKGLLRRDKRLKGKRYCIPATESVEEIVARINQVSPEPGEMMFAEHVVESVLDRHYPCPADE